MQVFKSYFKILNRHMGQMIMYLSIFIGVMVVLTATRTNKAEDDYEATKPKFAVFDYDKSSESKALTAYLKKTCTQKNIKNDKKETMQDELFARNVNCVLIIKEGFKLDVVTIPGTQAATTFESAINSFTKTYNTYIASGYSEADALAAVNTSLSQKASVSLLSGKNVTSHSGI
jgi:ABC-2 type transporter